MKLNDIRSDLTDISAKTKTLVAASWLFWQRPIIILKLLGHTPLCFVHYFVAISFIAMKFAIRLQDGCGVVSGFSVTPDIIYGNHNAETYILGWIWPTNMPIVLEGAIAER